MAPGRSPNDGLRILLAEASYSAQELVRAVNAIARESGLTLAYDRSAGSRWLAGVRPPPQTAAVIVEALSRRIGRPVTLDEAGLGSSGVLPAGEFHGREGGGVTGLIALAAADADPARRVLLRDAVFAVSATWAPPWTEKAATPDPRAAPLPIARIGMPQVEVIKAMTKMFYNADASYGSGGIRAALIAYLAGDVSTWLRAPTAPTAPTVRPALLSATARMAYLTAFTCFDSDLQGLTQRYHLRAADLAREAHDPAVYATVLRGMSVQADALGHHASALHLAETAVQSAAVVSGAVGASLTGQLALTEAKVGDRHRALAHLSKAERLLDAADDAGGTLGPYHQAAFADQHAEVLATLGDRAGAINALTDSLGHRPDPERRSRAIATARLAELQLDIGHLEAACASGHLFLEDYAHLHSARADSALTLLRARLRPYQHNAAARTLLNRIRTLTAAAGP